VSTQGTRGLVTTLQRGGTAIRASIGATGTQHPGIFDEVFVTITSPALDSISITPAEASVEVAQTQPFSARGTFSDGPSLDLTGQVTWTSAVESLAHAAQQVDCRYARGGERLVATPR
jgi:hypothetical protein